MEKIFNFRKSRRTNKKAIRHTTVFTIQIERQIVDSDSSIIESFIQSKRRNEKQLQRIKTFETVVPNNINRNRGEEQILKKNRKMFRRQFVD